MTVNGTRYSPRSPGDGAASAGNGGPAHYDGGDHFHLQVDAGVGGNLAEAYRIQKRGTSGQRAGDGENSKNYAPGIDAGQSRGIRVASGGVDGAPGREVTKRPPGRKNESGGNCVPGQVIGICRGICTDSKRD